MAQMLSRPAATELIEVSIIDGEAFVWSAASIAELRREHGIIGLLTGSLPLIPQQNAFLGVPLQLFDEEVVYLLRRKSIVLVDDARAHAVDDFDNNALETWHERRYGDLLDQQRIASEKARLNREKYQKKNTLSGAALEKKKQREERKEEAGHRTTGEERLFSGRQMQPPKEDGQTAIHIAYSISIPASSSKLDWHAVKPGINTFHSLSTAAMAGLWQYPKNAKERARCAAFEALKLKGYYLGKGLRFGGDFVVYPGDPLRYHSHFTATVQTTPQYLISAHELIAAGRLGTAVKKAHLLCSVTVPSEREEESEDRAWQRRLAGEEDLAELSWGSVDFISLTWAGFGI